MCQLPTASEVAAPSLGWSPCGSPDPAVMRAAGFTGAMVEVSRLRVGDVRVSGGQITGLTTSKSGKTTTITTTGIGGERISPACRVTVWRRAGDR